MSRADNLLGLRINHEADDYVARHLQRKYAHRPSFGRIGWHDERVRWDFLTCAKLTDYMENAVRRIDIIRERRLNE